MCPLMAVMVWIGANGDVLFSSCLCLNLRETGVERMEKT